MVEIVHWSEPSLMFNRGQVDRIIDPKLGLIKFGPYDYNTLQRKFNNVFIKVVCLKDQGVISKVMRLIRNLNTQTEIQSKWKTVRYPYKNFKALYKADLIEPSLEDDFVFINTEEMDYVANTDNIDEFKERFLELYRQKFQYILDKGLSSNTVMYVHIPRKLESEFLRLKEAFNVKGIDLRSLIKVLGVECRVKTQVITDKALEPPDLADTLWNLSLATYVKAGGRPWLIKEIPPSSVFVGIRHGIRKYEKDQVIAIGVAEIFNIYGEFIDMVAIDFVDKDQQIPELWNKKPYLTQRGMYRIISKAIEAYTEHENEKPYSVTIHRTLDFTEDEIRGALNALSGVKNVNMLHIIENTNLRILPEGKDPMRGTFLKLEEYRGLLYTTGYSEAEETYPGIGTPRPLELMRYYGNRNIEELALQVYSLTRMDWNTTRVMLREPVTIKYAKRVTDIVKLGVKGGLLVRDIRYYF